MQFSVAEASLLSRARKRRNSKRLIFAGLGGLFVILLALMAITGQMLSQSLAYQRELLQAFGQAQAELIYSGVLNLVITAAVLGTLLASTLVVVLFLVLRSDQVLVDNLVLHLADSIQGSSATNPGNADRK